MGRGCQGATRRRVAVGNAGPVGARRRSNARSHAEARRLTRAPGATGPPRPPRPPQVVVLTSASLEESKLVDEICRAHSPPIAFIRAETRGVFASVFCDFGPAFTVFDTDGEHRVGAAARWRIGAGAGAERGGGCRRAARWRHGLARGATFALRRGLRSRGGGTSRADGLMQGAHRKRRRPTQLAAAGQERTSGNGGGSTAAVTAAARAATPAVPAGL